MAQTQTTKPTMTLRQVEREFATADACKALLTQLRWPDGKVHCPRCGLSAKVYKTSETFRWKCKHCNKKGSQRLRYMSPISCVICVVSQFWLRGNLYKLPLTPLPVYEERLAFIFFVAILTCCMSNLYVRWELCP